MAYDNTNSGALFKNDRKEKESHPGYTGTVNIEGKEYWISAWAKDGAKGKFLSLAFKPKDGQRQPQRQQAAPSARDTFDDFDDSSIPF